MDLATLLDEIASGETLRREFKSDRGPLSDHDLYTEVVGMANAEGGIILLGVDDDGTITGIQRRNNQVRNPIHMQGAIFNNSQPHLTTRITVVSASGGDVAVIRVPRSAHVCAATDGRCVKRIIGGDGKPATAPFLPAEQEARRVDLGQLDYSAQVSPDAAWDDLDPLEFERLRQTIGRLRGDPVLLELESDHDLATALRLVKMVEGRPVPNIAGLLLLGREEHIHNLVPTHEVNFQVLDAFSSVEVNDSYHGPLLRVLEEVQERFTARYREKEIMVGMYRLPVPDYSPEGFREAVINALVHRDYTRLAQIYVQWLPESILISNPGGFPSGITIENLLTHVPTPRNPRLVEACRRIGIVEQTGRGVDRIYLGQLRYGRPEPDYSSSTADRVEVVLSGGSPADEFAKMVYQQDQEGQPLTLEDLRLLSLLRNQGPHNSSAMASRLHLQPPRIERALQALEARGLAFSRQDKAGETTYRVGKTRGTAKTVSRLTEAERTTAKDKILRSLRGQGSINRTEAAQAANVPPRVASQLLKEVAAQHPEIRLEGQRRWARYFWGDKAEL